MQTNTLSTPQATVLGSEESFRLLVEGVKDYAIIMLDPDGNVASWNAGAQRSKGYRSEEIVGKHFSAFYTPEDFQPGLPDQELAIAAKEGRFEDEGWRVRKDGQKFWANVIITALRDKDGTLRGFSKVTRDLTDLKQADEQIQQQAKEIMELSTPVMQVWQGVVVRAAHRFSWIAPAHNSSGRLLDRIVETNSPVALVDIMGVPTIDTQTAQHLIETISAVRMLGAQVVLTGVRPAIAQTLVHLGIDLSGIITRPSLSAGLQGGLDVLNLRIVAKENSR